MFKYPNKDDLKKVPFEKWKKLFLECYDAVLLDISDFDVGESADNGFLEVGCFCEKLNQTSADIDQQTYCAYILEDYPLVKKKVTITLEREVEVFSNVSDDMVAKIAFPHLHRKDRKEFISGVKIEPLD